ncbi:MULTISPECIES: acyl-[acyl-carrier-protein] thioesterase [unclassified Lactobacillus]|uniref:acyl-[acyl-carrier-protein] thioesterase n=1 Tax=unclassified Lactobacillus TaxID=2620435 RepID=UPI000EFC2477|nr:MULTISPECIES: acyl-ACP thioesterase domain-containing protein [unclassified Lactobacillus]RMC38394.1 acyl-[acyl-carrier-protein] thioesterase [Lactobacillus sp. ESL0237]RMC43202.1 acyl-[acyl-carrier-protein] thioesterase [Lactobacillus sp. ESL0234]RMC44229.1 acyl-[acyl-carrier-protein] thioesterase [Lactobacillus sp. ESL0236]RMC49196.1 acyl-[acyl-carrier-protein] thioesterase [Lactobacillus sp. ESL0225]
MRYSEKHQVEFYECDENENLKLPAMIDLMMSVSEHQLSSGIASTNALAKKGLGWVVTQYHIEINRLPKPNEEIIVSTEPVGYNRFLEYRNYLFSDQKGNELINVESEWVLFDLQKRKLVSTDQEMMAEIGIPFLKKLPRFPRLRVQAKYDKKRQYRVCYDDLDTNHHMTNGHYFNWFIDMFDREFLKQHVAKVIDIKFNLEVRYGDLPYSCITTVDHETEIKSYHAISDQDRNDKSVCEILWRKL